MAYTPNPVLGKNEEPTVGEIYTQRIEEARRFVEQLCIKKAKLEALNMLNMPYRQLSDLFDIHPY